MNIQEEKTVEESQSSPTQLLWQLKEGRWEEFHWEQH